jgi:dTDP-4-amino-4,6-dideoxygalactose transaminase
MCAAAELGTDDEIIVPAYTFPATASPFAYEGVRVVFADADPRTGNIDPAHVEKLVTARTRAVLVTHLWGLPCDMDALSALCARHNLMLLEDCSHAHFARWRGKKVGTFGAMAAFSFNQKALSTGEGGILVTGDDRLRDLALLHGHYNQRSRQEIDPGRPYYAYARTGMGLKSRMHPLAAAVGLDQLNKAPRIEAARRATLARFAEALDGQHTVELCDVDPQTGEHGLYVAGFRVRPGSGLARDDLMRQLAAHGAGCFDVPGSTRDISAEPLFHRPARTSGWDTVPPVPTGTAGQFPGVAAFTQAFFKAPLWGHPHDVTTVERHLRALNDVAHNAST